MSVPVIMKKHSTISKHCACNITRCRSVLLMCSSVLGTEVTQPDWSSVTSVLGQFDLQKRTEVDVHQLSYGRGTARRAVSVKTTLNV